MQYEINRIIEVAIELKTTRYSPASTGERIAAAFVLNNMQYLPASYSDVVEAWERLGPQWQHYVKLIKSDYLHLIEGAG